MSITRIEGTISSFDLAKRVGTVIDLAGVEHLILPGSLRKTDRLQVGDRIWFASINLSVGPTAQDIEPGDPKGTAQFRGVRASQVPRKA
jgi:hypothetical protein